MVLGGDYNWQDLQQAVPCAQLKPENEVALFLANFAVFVLIPDHMCASMRVCSIAGRSFGGELADSPEVWTFLDCNISFLQVFRQPFFDPVIEENSSS